MLDIIRRLLRRPAPPPLPTAAEIHAALAELDGQRAEIDDALRAALDLRRAALLRDDDTGTDALDREIDQLGREQERAELLEQRLLDRAASLSNPFLNEQVQ